MNDEDKTTREKRKALIFDAVVILLAMGVFLQISVPAVLPLVDALKGKPAPVMVPAPQKAPAK